jgi:tetratricopeptide (TPR) repeat protein
MGLNFWGATAYFRQKNIYILLLLITGCSLEKKNFVDRNLQNLTAHYNILFNARVLLAQKQADYAVVFPDNYNNILNVYPDTAAKSTTSDKDLDAVIVKANTIINIKEQSHYIGDAYLILGKANYLAGNFFSAAEYFSYVIRLFPENTALAQEARVWKARSLIYLNQLPDAKAVLDTAIQTINPKKHKSMDADIYAARLQFDIHTDNYVEGQDMAEKAVENCNNKLQKLRWRFILAQVQELNQHPEEAFKNYTAIVNSNAIYEMAFNAELNRIRIEEVKSGQKLTRVDRLGLLLKNQNNKEFADQIYYQVAEYYFSKSDLDNAIKNYKFSVRASQKNQTQKGLSYLRIADIYFKNKADYITAKKYYDSTLTNLPPNYPGYGIIQKKSANLQILADRYKIIAAEDTLQMLARLDDKARAKRIDQLVEEEILKQQAVATANQANNNYTSTPGSSGNSSFYFYNTSAVSQGITDFKRKWGARKLEDNWRRSSRSSADLTTNTTTIAPNADPDAINITQKRNPSSAAATGYRQQLINGLPLSPMRLQQSDERIYNAYLDIANFYRDVLGDKNEAIANYQILLKRYPANPNNPAVYYSLYRITSETNPAASVQYKEKLLKDFPETVYAKIIVDPDYARKLTDKDAALTAAYDTVYNLYVKKAYKKTISSADSVLQLYPQNKYAPQLAYLRAMAAGHNETLIPFEEELQQIVNKYSTDRLVLPLVLQYLAFANANQAEMAARPVVLPDADSPENPFGRLRKQQVLKSSETFKEIYIKPEPPAPQIKKPFTKSEPTKTNVVKVKVPSNLFSIRDSTHYYFVVDVNSGTTNLASSRFGFGQFNRANFPPNSIKHLLLSVGPDNQLIYVGRFFSLKAVKDYARAVIPLLPEIMKVPEDKYTFFIITKENLDKLADKKTLDSYIDYYQNNY